ncbi:MAG: hypothetical protein KAV42_11495, partial [Candidatus Krumholzibacteria bacterium]|nr:hypothetical protein [Candidatus Krumholzibacteria bacterium]
MRETKDLKRFNIYILLLLSAAILYWPALKISFSLDDLRFLLRASGVEDFPDSIKRILSIRLFFQAGWKLFRTSSGYYHLVVVILHLINAGLIQRISKRLGLDDRVATYGALLFLVTPVAFLPMHWISGIQDVSMTFFVLLTVHLYMAKGTISAAGTLLAATLSLLCKEASLLMLPGLAICIPTSKRRRLVLGLSGSIIGILFLVLSGSFNLRPAGDPYESAFGVNIIWNLLTYSAWLIRFWDYFPDKIPQYQPSLAIWGLILPTILSIIVWRFRQTRVPLLKAVILFLLLLGPVLPLIRHSYFYYLYLPLVPFWILIGILLDRISNRKIAYAVLAVFFIYSSITGTIHRRAEIQKGVLKDPILRHAAILKHTVNELRDAGEIRGGDYLFVKNFEGTSVDLTKGLDGRTGTIKKKVHFFEQALLGGKALRLFHPEIKSVHFEDQSGPVTGWEHMHFFGTYGVAEIIYLGYGKEG